MDQSTETPRVVTSRSAIGSAPPAISIPSDEIRTVVLPLLPTPR